MPSFDVSALRHIRERFKDVAHGNDAPVSASVPDDQCPVTCRILPEFDNLIRAAQTRPSAMGAVAGFEPVAHVFGRRAQDLRNGSAIRGSNAGLAEEESESTNKS